MSSLRNDLLAFFDQLLAVCAEATPGPWHWVNSETDLPQLPGDDEEQFELSLRTVKEFPSRSVGLLPKFVVWSAEFGGEVTDDHANAVHIAAHDPSLMAAVWQGLRNEVERHRYENVPPYSLGKQHCLGCVPSGAYGLSARFDVGADCPFVTRWAAAVGLGDQPDDGTQTGDGERRTSAGHGESEGPGQSNGAAVVAAPNRSIRDLTEASSLGESDAVAARASVPDEQVAEVMDRVRAVEDDRCEYTHGGPAGHVDPCHNDREAHEGGALGHGFVPHPDALSGTDTPPYGHLHDGEFGLCRNVGALADCLRRPVHHASDNRPADAVARLIAAGNALDRSHYEYTDAALRRNGNGWREALGEAQAAWEEVTLYAEYGPRDPADDVEATCGAGNVAIERRYERCTLPAGHPTWTPHPTNGFSYNHCDVAADSWWNDGGPPRGTSREQWLSGTSTGPAQGDESSG